MVSNQIKQSVLNFLRFDNPIKDNAIQLERMSGTIFISCVLIFLCAMYVWMSPSAIGIVCLILLACTLPVCIVFSSIYSRKKYYATKERYIGAGFTRTFGAFGFAVLALCVLNIFGNGLVFVLLLAVDFIFLFLKITITAHLIHKGKYSGKPTAKWSATLGSFAIPIFAVLYPLWSLLPKGNYAGYILFFCACFLILYSSYGVLQFLKYHYVKNMTSA
jgi:hypothetical protein